MLADESAGQAPLLLPSARANVRWGATTSPAWPAALMSPWLGPLAKAAAVGVLVVASVGCNDGAPTAARNTAEVTIRYDADGDGGRPARTARLRCPSSEHRKACDLLTSLPGAAFRPVPARTFCTQIYGGPETGSIEGIIGRRAVSARYNRRNGCEIARMSRVAAILEVARTSGR